MLFSRFFLNLRAASSRATMTWNTALSVDPSRAALPEAHNTLRFVDSVGSGSASPPTVTELVRSLIMNDMTSDLIVVRFTDCLAMSILFLCLDYSFDWPGPTVFESYYHDTHRSSCVRTTVDLPGKGPRSSYDYDAHACTAMCV